MKKLLLSLAILLTIFTSCDEEIDCIEIFETSDWTTENFKSNYTIQFPDNYEGTGMVGFEGNFFFKNRSDDKVVIRYNYCGPLFCEDFGDSLITPNPSSVTAQDSFNNDVVLSLRKDFCLNNNIEGIFYYNEELVSTGVYYMKQGSEYMEGLTTYFANTESQEVENIIKSIVEN